MKIHVFLYRVKTFCGGLLLYSLLMSHKFNHILCSLINLKTTNQEFLRMESKIVFPILLHITQRVVCRNFASLFTSQQIKRLIPQIRVAQSSFWHWLGWCVLSLSRGLAQWFTENYVYVRFGSEYFECMCMCVCCSKSYFYKLTGRCVCPCLTQSVFYSGINTLHANRSAEKSSFDLASRLSGSDHRRSGNGDECGYFFKR